MDLLKATLVVLVLGFCCAVFQVSAQTQEIGRIKLIKGTTLAYSKDDSVRTLNQGDPVYLSDRIVTEKRSFAVIEYEDLGRIALQPNSQILLKEYNSDFGSEAKVVKLIKGALRSVSGSIGKRKPEAVQYETRGVTVGIRGTTFALRRCPEGAEQCTFNRAVTTQGTIEANQPVEGQQRIFRFDTSSGQRVEISRQELNRWIGATSVAIIDGKIWLQAQNRTFEMEVALAPEIRPAGGSAPSNAPPPPANAPPGQGQGQNNPPPPDNYKGDNDRGDHSRGDKNRGGKDGRKGGGGKK